MLKTLYFDWTVKNLLFPCLNGNIASPLHGTMLDYVNSCWGETCEKVGKKGLDGEIF